MSLPLASLPTWVLSSAATRSHQILQQHLSEVGVNGYQYRCLAALADQGQLSQAELGEAAALDPRDVTHTVRALADRGLVVREKDPNHGRKVQVSLTEAGMTDAIRLARIMGEVQDKVFCGLSAEELSTLLSLLARVGT